MAEKNENNKDSQMGQVTPKKKLMTKNDHSLAANLHLFPVTPNVLPELNANHPHQSMKSPTRALVGLPMGGVPLISQRPNRGPSMIDATKAVRLEWVGSLHPQ
jgi:hypothetical protein